MTAYHVITFKTEEDANEILKKYDVGEMFVVDKEHWKNLSDEKRKKNEDFENTRYSIDKSLPSRTSENIFVFSNKKYAHRWAATLHGRAQNFFLLTLELEGSIKWFNAEYYYSNEPENYWASASDTPEDTPLCEGIFTGSACIIRRERY